MESALNFRTIKKFYRTAINFYQKYYHHTVFRDKSIEYVYKNKAHLKEVKSSKPNELGIYEMSGNASEFCSDWYDKSYYKKSPKQDPQGPEKGKFKVCRGGSYCSEGLYYRIPDRDYWGITQNGPGISLRLKMVKK